ncbi:arginine--tRNA ligase [Candidatus Woesebacteria bacterium RIFCSPHIGHO2_01_FULL_44_10]|nr:MAG: arginine--tRNA ligase [Candidatus Woesebacteria bacterium RIFCSPHIGHO2_01_FULL_44_10]
MCKELFKVEVEPELTRPDEQFGDYSTNVAMQLAKKLNNPLYSGPREIAEAIVAKIKSPDVLKAEIAGPGFINLSLTDTGLWDLAKNEPTKSMVGKVVVAEYSDPNPFKVLHAGHLYTTITGDAIASLLEHAGAKVHRLNYGGDVGLHVGKTTWAIVKRLGGENVKKLDDVKSDDQLEWLSARYVEGNEAYETDETAKAEIVDCNKKVYQLHKNNDHASTFAQIYWTCRQWSYDGFDRLYNKLRIDPFEKYVPESVVTPKAIELVQKGLTEKVFEKSDGAIVFKGEKDGLHTRVFLTSDGLPTYEAKDLGLAATKWLEYHFDLSLIITGNEIAEYMKVVLKALEHFYPEVVQRSKHFTHGMIKPPGGIKMSSRKGTFLRASDILEAANKANLAANGQENDNTVLAAVKYAFLKTRISGDDIIYNPDESVALEGNSGPYLQYAHARACSILAKSSFQGQTLETQKSETNRDENSALRPPPSALEATERSLLRKIGEYAEVVDKAVAELMPHHVCTYLYELAQEFNRFYEKNRVIGDKREALRTQLVQMYADVLKNGLELLNIPAPEKM